jgi:lysine 2-monooxygenase
VTVRSLPQVEIDTRVRLAEDDDFDIAVIGAGMSGLYTAWRMASEWRSSPKLAALASARPDGLPRITIIEWSDRVGGRLDSRIIADMENVPAELGGMRYTPGHLMVCELVKRFALASEPFPMTKSSQFYMRGARFSEASVSSGNQVPPYQLEPAELKQTPNQLFNFAIQRACNYQSTWSDANWQWVKEHATFTDAIYKQVPFYDIGFWNLLYRTLSNEGYDYVWDGGGYNSNTINWNSAEAMPYMLTDFSVTPSFSRLVGGYYQLPLALATAVVGLGVPIIGNVRLVRFDTTAGVTRCQVERTDGSGIKGSFTTQILVLAMPRRSLELIEQDCEFFTNERVRFTIQSVIPQPSFKLFMAYENRWWNRSEFFPGPTITDLPLRMTYDFGSESERGGAKNDHRTLLLAGYADMQADTFWSVLERETPFTKPPSESKTGSRGGTVPNETMCRMAENMLLKVMTVNGVTPTISKRIGAYYQDWSQEPYGGGYHAWAAHYKAWEIMREVRQPIPSRDIFICGEAYSNGQGWVEGALCTAESVLEDMFQFPRLSGIPASYVLLTPTPIPPGSPESAPAYTSRDSKYVF